MSSLCSLLHQYSQKKQPEKKDYVFKKQLRRKMLIVNQNLHLRLLCQVAVVLLQNSLLCRDGQRMWCERGKRNQTSPSSVPRTAILNQTGWDRNQSGRWLRTELQGLEPQVHVSACRGFWAWELQPKAWIQRRRSSDLYCIMFQVCCTQPHSVGISRHLQIYL